jgi:cardiolipin synthase
VDVEMYLWDGDDVGRRFADALSRAARRGARVRVLADAQGARDAFPLLREIAAAGGDVRLFNPFRLRFWRRYFHRTHKKLLVLDGEVAFAGGAGFSLSWTRGKRRERPWHDRMYEFRGPVVAQFGQVFVADFERWDPGRVSGGATAPRGTHAESGDGDAAPAPDPWTEDTAPSPPPSPDAALRVLRGWPDRRDFLPAILAAVGRARERVWIGTPYFLPPRSLRRALYVAARRGVDVQVVVPSAEHANLVLYDAVRARYGRWLRRGVHLHEFPAAFYHAKTFVVDRTFAVVGSSNLDSWSIRRNAELDVAVGDEATVERIAALLAEDRAAARPVTREDARIGNFLREILMQVASALENWL